MSYVDGFVAAVPKSRKAEYTAFAEAMAKLILSWGATRVVENWSEDVQPGKLTDFYRAVAAQEDEDIVFSWVEYPDKATREKVQKLMMSDETMAGMSMPFDGKRLIYGGFGTIVSAS